MYWVLGGDILIKKRWILEFKKYMRYMRMEENIKNIASEVNEELIKLFGGNLVKLRTKRNNKKTKRDQQSRKPGWFEK